MTGPPPLLNQSIGEDKTAAPLVVSLI